MAKLLLGRLIAACGTLLAASLVVFLVLELLPGDVAEVILETTATDESVAALREKLGLSRSLPLRYVEWVWGLVSGDWGISPAYGVPVRELISERLAVSLPLAIYAFFIAAVVGLPAGIYSGLRRGRLGGIWVNGLAQVGLALPNFWFGLLMILLFAVLLKWAPSGGFPGWDAGFLMIMISLTLPAIALASGEAAVLTRITRSAVLEVAQATYVRTARAKGASPARVLFSHILRNAMIPVLTIMGLQISFLFAGSVIVENVFYLPGIGRLALQAIFQRDLVIVRDLVMLFCVLVVAMSFFVDLVSICVDRRILRRMG